MTAIPTPPDGEYPLEEAHSEHYGPELILFVDEGQVHLHYPGGDTSIKSAALAEQAAKALLYWSAWKREQDIIAWLAAEDRHRKDLRRLGLYSKGRLGRGA